MGGGLSRARVEESGVRLRESDLIVGAKNEEEDMTFILKDPRNLRPSLSLSGTVWGGGAASRELVTQYGSSFFFCCLSSFFLLFFFCCFFFCRSGWGSLHRSSDTHVYHVYILYACVYHMMRYVCPSCVARTFLAIDRQYYVAQLPGSDPNMGGGREGGRGGRRGGLIGILPLYDLSLRKMKAEDPTRFLSPSTGISVDL